MLSIPSFPRRPAWLALCLALLLALPARAAEPLADWLTVVRETPYWASQGMAANLATIRRWVLFGSGFCSVPQRHLLFDRRGRFLAYSEDADSAQATMARINAVRERMAREARVSHWSPGSLEGGGYPFALGCNQRYVNMAEAIARLSGEGEDYRVWGTWDGMRVGSEDAPVSLAALFRIVLEHRKAQGRFSFPDEVMPTFLGKTLIESGGRKDALSTRDARGILQLRPEVLDDCEIPVAFRLHRMAQVDCALRLVEQNHRNLAGPFEAVFGHLPAAKRKTLYGFLLTQAYQIGVGRMIELLRDEELGAAARYFAARHQRFSAEDIQAGMIFHNLGRRDIGLLSLYYVTDARLAREALCESAPDEAGDWCPPRAAAER